MTTATELDAYAPCAFGAIEPSSSLVKLRVAIVCGAANNQVSSTSVEPELQDRAIAWPDDVATSGGLIQVAREPEHRSTGELGAQVGDVYETVCGFLACVAGQDPKAGGVADHFADAHLLAAVR